LPREKDGEQVAQICYTGVKENCQDDQESRVNTPPYARCADNSEPENGVSEIIHEQQNRRGEQQGGDQQRNCREDMSHMPLLEKEAGQQNDNDKKESCQHQQGGGGDQGFQFLGERDGF